MRALAAATIARAIGCSLSASTPAASRSTSSSLVPSVPVTAVTVWAPLATAVVVHVTEYGDVVSSLARLAPSTRNCTPVTPTLSVAVAVTATEPVTVVLFAGAVTETDGGHVPSSARHPETTVLVPVGSVRVIEFTPEQPGDWAMHCHMTHHVMTQMGHGLPPMVGVDTKVLETLVELRFFGGLSLPEVAEHLGISLSTAERGWRYARAWLYTAMAGEGNPAPA